jgi:hypothetical protein
MAFNSKIDRINKERKRAFAELATAREVKKAGGDPARIRRFVWLARSHMRMVLILRGCDVGPRPYTP